MTHRCQWGEKGTNRCIRVGTFRSWVRMFLCDAHDRRVCKMYIERSMKNEAR